MNKQAGFTLIEIIAVLVILGILAAVAIPKYQDLQDEAGEKAAAGVAGAVLSQMTLAYSATLLSSNGNTTAAVDNAVAECSNFSYDNSQFSVTCGEGAGGITVTHIASNRSYTTGWEDPS
jgi:MSHA pilin protein MshA